mmetsp:Transcript_28463/g.60359  ORF Transcript_28463/g.60359 Transcript_28463/m.60359 type:complete len:405 (-) Transcript_28463:92-1306(-)
MGITKEVDQILDADGVGELSSADEESLFGGEKGGSVAMPIVATVAVKRLFTPRHCATLLAAVGLAVLVVCAVSKAASSPAHQHRPGGRRPLEPHQPLPPLPPAPPTPSEAPPPQVMPAMKLFTSARVHEVATENLMRAGQAVALRRDSVGRLVESTVELLEPAERTMVFEIVEAGFRNIGIELRQQAPRLAGELDRIGLEEQDQTALLNMMLLMSDTRVQRLGIVVARSIRDNPSADKAALVHKFEEELLPRRGEVKLLQRDLVSKPLLELWGHGHDWEMTFESRNLHEMATYSRTFDESIKDVAPETKHAAVFGGVLEQGKVLVYVLKNCIRTLVPTWSTNVNGTVDEMAHFVATESSSSDFMAALLWPLKFGAQGIDVLRSLSDMEYNLPDRSLEQPVEFKD